MIFHENPLLTDDSHEISYLFFFQELGKMSQNLLSAAVMIGALRVKGNGLNMEVEISYLLQYGCSVSNLFEICWQPPAMKISHPSNSCFYK